MNFNEYLKIAKEQAAADYGIDVSAFDGGAHVFKAKPFTSRAIKTKTAKPFLDMVFFGNGIVTVADDSIADYISEYLRRLKDSYFRAFDAPNLFELNEYIVNKGFKVGEMAQGFLPLRISEELKTPEIGRVKALYGEEIAELYGYGEFGEALCYSITNPRRDVIAVACFGDNNRPIAVAACSNDGEKMYQIGVDVLPEYRRRGVASVLVTKLAAVIAEKEICPYYRCAWSNIASRRTAYSCGFLDAWVELSATPIDKKYK